MYIGTLYELYFCTSPGNANPSTVIYFTFQGFGIPQNVEARKNKTVSHNASMEKIDIKRETTLASSARKQPTRWVCSVFRCK